MTRTPIALTDASTYLTEVPDSQQKSDSCVLRVRGTGIAMRGNDIDTDRIIPARFLKAVTFDDLGNQVFFDERFDQQGKTKSHPFNDPAHQGASILLVNRNFGCGSSREHAPQALMRWGIRAIIGESFGEIFASNCQAIGIPAAHASAEDIAAMMTFVQNNPDQNMELDIEAGTAGFGTRKFQIQLPESAKTALISGSWDSLQSLLDADAQIEATALRLPYTAFNTWAQPPTVSDHA